MANDAPQRPVLTAEDFARLFPQVPSAKVTAYDPRMDAALAEKVSQPVVSIFSP